MLIAKSTCSATKDGITLTQARVSTKQLKPTHPARFTHGHTLPYRCIFWLDAPTPCGRDLRRDTALLKVPEVRSNWVLRLPPMMDMDLGLKVCLWVCPTYRGYYVAVLPCSLRGYAINQESCVCMGVRVRISPDSQTVCCACHR